MLVTSVCVATLCLVDITVSHFCINPEFNAWRYASHFSNIEIVDQLTDHYLLGREVNPILHYTNTARKYMDNIEYQYWKFRPHFDFLEGLCAASTGIDLEPVFATINTVLDHTDEVLDSRNIWEPLGEGVIRNALCTNLVLVTSLNCLVSYVLGVLLVPVWLIANHIFLLEWSRYMQIRLARPGETLRDLIVASDKMEMRAVGWNPKQSRELRSPRDNL